MCLRVFENGVLSAPLASALEVRAFVLTFWVSRKIDRAIAGFREYALVWCQVEVCDLVPALVRRGSDRAILRSDGYSTLAGPVAFSIQYKYCFYIDPHTVIATLYQCVFTLSSYVVTKESERWLRQLSSVASKLTPTSPCLLLLLLCVVAPSSRRCTSVLLCVVLATSPFLVSWWLLVVGTLSPPRGARARPLLRAARHPLPQPSPHSTLYKRSASLWACV